jgi:hypothetical protein
MAGPYNYLTGPQTAINPQNFLVGMEAGGGLLNAQQVAQDRAAAMQAQQQAQQSALLKAQQEAAKQAEFDAVANAPGGPTTEALQRLMIKYPDRAEMLRKTFDTLQPAEQEARKGQMLRISSAIRAGNHNVAIDDARNLAKAYGNAGRDRDAAAMEQVAKTIEEDPEGAGRNLDMQLAAILGPDFAKTMTTIDTREADVAKAQAEASIKGTEARFAADKALADLGLTKARINEIYAKIKNDADRLGLDREKMQADVAAALTGVGKVPPEVFKEVNDTYRQSAIAAQSAAKARELAGKFRAYGKSPTSSVLAAGSGAPAAAAEFAKGQLGFEDDVSAMRKQYNALKNSDVIKNLPPGTASDNDIAMMQAGFPSATSNPAAVAEFLDAMTRVQEGIQRVKGLEGEFLAKNGYLGPARTDMVIKGVPVKAGQTFDQVVADTEDTE